MTEMTKIYPIWFQKSDPSTVAVGMDQGVVSISSPLTPELPSLSWEYGPSSRWIARDVGAAKL